MRITSVYITLLLLGSVTLMLRGQSPKDSLWRVWNDTTQPDTVRLKAIQALTWPMLNVSLDSAYLLASMQLKMAEEKKLDYWIARAYYNIATHYYYRTDYIHALDYYTRSLEIRIRLGDLKGEAAIYGNLGLIFGQQGNTLKELELQRKALAINEKLRDTSGMTSNYSNLGIIYHQLDDTIQALEYYHRALDMYHPIKDRKHIAITYNNIGNLYRQALKYDKALYYLLESLKIRNELGDRLGLAITHVNLGTAYVKMHRYAEARAHVLESMENFQTYGDSGSLANTYFTMGDIAYAEGKFHEAIEWCKRSVRIAETHYRPAVIQAGCGCLYKAYKSLGQMGEALNYFEQYTMWEDSLKKDELEMALNRFEFEKELLTDSLSRAEEQTRLRLTHQIEMTRKNRTSTFLLAGGLIILLLAFLLLIRLLAYQRNAQRLEQRTELLEKQQLVNEISLLKTQVNPHFLFNSLSILSSLVRIDPELSERFIDQLSRSYRYILEQKDQSLVTLRTELGFIESYAFLLKIRFEHKFNLEIQIPDTVQDNYKIAPMTLQLLVENAVKHNRMSLAEPLVVEVIAGDEEVLLIRNKLQPRSTAVNSTGMGLHNIINRYALLTDRPVRAGEGDGYFAVSIPLLN